MSTSAFANEMSKIANVKLASTRKRMLEAGLGAVLGGGATYLATGSQEGAAAGGVVGAGAGLLAGRLGVHQQYAKRLKEFLTTKKITDSAQQLVEGSPLMSRPMLKQQQLDTINTHDLYPNYFRRAARQMGADPKVFDGIPALRAKEKSLLDELAHARKTRNHHERLMMRQMERNLPVSDKLIAPVANLEEHEKGLKYQIQGIRSVIDGREALKRDVEVRAKAMQKALREKIRTEMRQAKDAIKAHEEAHAELLAKSEKDVWEQVNSRLFGVF